MGRRTLWALGIFLSITVIVGSVLWFRVIKIVKAQTPVARESYVEVNGLPKLEQLQVVDFDEGRYLRIAVVTPPGVDGSTQAVLQDLVTIYKWGAEKSNGQTVIWLLQDDLFVPAVIGEDVEIYQVRNVYWLDSYQVPALLGKDPVTILELVQFHLLVMTASDGVHGGVLTPDGNKAFLGFKNIPW